jgi:hypothetical protein
MGWTCSTYWGNERCIQGFDGEKLRETDHLKDLGLEGRIILKWISKQWDVFSGLDVSG